MAMCMDWMVADDEVVVSTALHKEHEITAPGTSKILSVAEFKAECATDVLQPGQLKIKDPGTLDAALSKEMGITTEALKEIRKVCE